MDMDADTHTKYARNGKVMLGTAILLFLMLLIIIFLHTYSCFCFRRRHRQRHLPPNRHLLPTLSASTAAANSKGLDPSLFKFLPTFTYSSASHRPLQECAVCLSEFEEGDEGRVLPNCNHGFHTPCIDTWFRSHSSCPICRAAVQPLKIPAQRKETCVPEGELAGCSYLPPPIGCPRKALDVELRREELDGGESGLKSSDEQILRLKGIWR